MAALRVGILPFGERSADETALADDLRAAEVDVILADAPVTSYDSARDEASRLARADCDGILVHVAAFADPKLVGIAALYLAGMPLLLSGPYPPVWLDAAGVLAELGVPFDRNRIGVPDSATLQAWLRQNSRVERQRGRSAAQTIYGHRLAVEGAIAIDAAQWMHQFGVIVGPASEASDFSAPDGDACGALTRRLLALVHPTADEPVYDLPVGDSQFPFPVAETTMTLARISRRRGRYQCVLAVGPLDHNHLMGDTGLVRLHQSLLSGKLHAISGEHLGAMRAACEALDIEPVVI